MPRCRLVLPSTPTMSSPITLSPLLAERQSVDHKSSYFLAKQLKAYPKYAWHHPRVALRELVETGRYVEGLVADWTREPYMIHEHAWVQIPGAIVDPSSRFVRVSHQVAYFPAHTWTWEQLVEMYHRECGEMMLPLAPSLPFSGKNLPSYRSALVAAHRHLSAVHLRDTGAVLYKPEHEERLLRSMFEKAVRDGCRTAR